VVLAAGAATRYGSPKQRLLLAEVLDRLSGSTEIGEVVVVTGAYDVDTDARVVACPDWERGPGASLRCGLEALHRDTSAAVVILADGPDLSPDERVGIFLEDHYWNDSDAAVVFKRLDPLEWRGSLHLPRQRRHQLSMERHRPARLPEVRGP